MSGGTQKSLRKALGALKDTTTVSLAKVNSDYKELDVSIVKATNHYERPARERHIRAIFAAVSATRPRADVAYCIHALARRLSRTHNWAVALKTLIVIHRALREVDPTFYEEIINYGRTRSHMLNMAHFKDDSSPNAWDYSAWVRAYALFLEERLECFRVLKYDVEMDRPRTKDLDTVEILEQLPALQQLLFRVLGCQPQGAAVNNFVIQLALQLVSSESIRVYQAITDGTANLVDKFFEMTRLDALKALEIYRRACQQAERLSEFYEICKSMDIGRGERFIKIEQPPSSFLQTMEEYVRDAPRMSIARKDQFVDNKIAAPKEILAIEYKKEPGVEEECPPSPPPPEPVKVEEPVAQPPDLLGLGDPLPVASELDEKNALALAIVPVAEQQSTAIPSHANGTTGWELALVTAPSSNESAAAASKLAGGLDKLTLDSLYDDAIRRSNQPVSYNPWEPAPMANPMMQTAVHDPFFASNMVAAPHSVQMAQMASQQQAFMLQQQQQQQQQMQLRQQMQQQAMQPASSLKRPFDGGICARRLMQYLYHQRQRLAENTIAYWRKFVAEYYSPRAKKRWCLSLYDNVGHHALGVFPQASMEVWQCDICGSKSGRGFEATFEVLPRLNEIKFGSGVIDELLFLDMPREIRLPSGIMMLEYAKAVQESVYEQLRVVREGQLRVIFTQDLKILSWEFCVRRHEELLPRRVVAPQVNQLLQVAQKCQSTIAESGSDGVSQQDLQTNSNMVLTASRQLAKSLELQSLNDLGFSKRYVRCLQISEVVNSMKDLIDFCREQKVGPIEGLKSYPRHATAAKLQIQKMQEMEQLASVQGLPTDRNTLNKLMALHPGINSHVNTNHQMVGRGTLSGPAQAALALTNFQNLLRRQNSMNSNSSSQQEAASPFNNSNQSPSSNFQGTANFIPGSMQNLPVSGFSSPHLPPQQPQQMQQRSLSSNSLLQQSIPQSSQGNQALQPHMIQQLLQEMSNNSGGGVQQHSLSGQSGNGGMTRSGLGFGSNTLATPPTASTVSVGAGGLAPSRSNSFKAAANSDSSAAGGNSGFNQKVLDLPPNLHLQDDLVSDIAHEFTENGFFNSDLDDNMGYGWKA